MKNILLDFAKKMRDDNALTFNDEKFLETYIDRYVIDEELKNSKVYECENTECNHFTPIDFNVSDVEGVIMCPECQNQINNSLLKEAVKIIIESKIESISVKCFLDNFDLNSND